MTEMKNKELITITSKSALSLSFFFFFFDDDLLFFILFG